MSACAVLQLKFIEKKIVANCVVNFINRALCSDNKN